MTRSDLLYFISVNLLCLFVSCLTPIADSSPDVLPFRSTGRSEYGQRRELACSTAGSNNVIGVNWGQYYIDDPPPASLVVEGLKSYGFNAVKVYGVLSDEVTLALSHTDIQVTIAVDGALLNGLAGGIATTSFSHVSVNDAGVTACTKWLMDSVVGPVGQGVRIKNVVVGNEPDWLGGNDQILIQVMNNFNSALAALNLTGSVFFIIPLRYSVMGTVFPPSNGSFKSNITEIPMLLQLLNASASPFAINLYTFVSDDSEPFDPTGYLKYLTFQTPSDQGLVDTSTKAMYQNQFEFEYDAVLQAVRTAGYPNMKVIVTETGWPTSGTTFATTPLASNFSNGLESFLDSGNGTPLCPHCPLEIYMFELYDEPNKDVSQGKSEQFYGISTYQGGKLLPKFPFGANCNIPFNQPLSNQQSQASSGAASNISRSFLLTLGTRKIRQLFVKIAPQWPPLVWGFLVAFVILGDHVPYSQ